MKKLTPWQRIVLFTSAGQSFFKSIFDESDYVIIVIVIVVIFLGLIGCAGTSDKGLFAGSGGSTYEYKRTLPDGTGCNVTVVSGADMQGANLTIDKDCAVTTKVDGTSGVKEAIGLANTSVQAVREAVSKVP
jgi:hypothetical protein